MCGGNMPLGEAKPKRWRYKKMLPCPRCGTDEHLSIYEYEGGWKRVECDGPGGPNDFGQCGHISHSCGRIADAIEDHNKSAAPAAMAAERIKRYPSART